MILSNVVSLIGTTERMVGTLTRAVKLYVEDIDQRDWDEYAERLTFALNTAQDRVRGDTPFYLLHGWAPRSTLEAMIPLGSTRRRDRGPRRWRYRIQKQYQQALHLEITGTEYRLFPVVHVSKLKPVRQVPDRPQMRLTIQDQDRFDFDEALLPEDSWTRDLDTDEYEVEKIVDMRSGKRTRYGRTLREFLVHWKGYDEPTWVDEADLNCGALLYDCSQVSKRRRLRARC
ncbi:Reverse transcriptase [Phytophthora palmivora]|uniref:Reverse transcriptase n=1 Tax=Phytophthora palmivora TaxID=4796 RepID=A0A2P4YHI4_9STRA|nr:Reverse transcriptase [Phytophthora palmivora]